MLSSNITRCSPSMATKMASSSAKPPSVMRAVLQAFDQAVVERSGMPPEPFYAAFVLINYIF
ncbi:MAG: hypothetical protein Q7J46_06915 [Pseudomonas sp.]|nr:hypothetical protein [Pseudomonas sp.]